MVKRHRRQGSSSEHELSLAAADEVERLIGFVVVEMHDDGQSVVRVDGEDEEDRDALLIRALWALGEVARRVTGEGGEDA